MAIGGQLAISDSPLQNHYTQNNQSDLLVSVWLFIEIAQDLKKDSQPIAGMPNLSSLFSPILSSLSVSFKFIIALYIKSLAILFYSLFSFQLK